MFEKNFPKKQYRQRAYPNQKRHRVGFIEVLEEMACVSPKTAVSAMKTEKLGQLCAGKKKRHAAFEAGHDTL